MNRSWFALAVLVVSVTLVGCGGSGATGVSAEKDEVAKWVEDNPTPLVESDAGELDFSSE